MKSAWSEAKTHRCKTRGLENLVRNVKKETSKRDRRNAKLVLRSGGEVIDQKRLDHHDL